LESIPALITFTATDRLTGSVCWAMKTDPMPPWPISSISLYFPAIKEPTASPPPGDPGVVALPRQGSASNAVSSARREEVLTANSAGSKGGRSSGLSRRLLDASRSLIRWWRVGWPAQAPTR
jgi:hypothetical protein